MREVLHVSKLDQFLGSSLRGSIEMKNQREGDALTREIKRRSEAEVT